jgi:hypothetical protein
VLAGKGDGALGGQAMVTKVPRKWVKGVPVGIRRGGRGRRESRRDSQIGEEKDDEWRVMGWIELQYVRATGLGAWDLGAVNVIATARGRKREEASEAGREGRKGGRVWWAFVQKRGPEAREARAQATFFSLPSLQEKKKTGSMAARAREL